MKIPFVLYSEEQPWIYISAGDVSSMTNFAWQASMYAPSSFAARLLRGKRMQSWDTFFNESAAALQFPYYFGQNLNAFDDCLADLSWIKEGGYLIVILDSNEFLAKESDDDFALAIHHLRLAAGKWSRGKQASLLECQS
jgi:hypothetical protein